MLGDERRILEIERRLEMLARDNDALRRRLTAAEQLARQLAGLVPPTAGTPETVVRAKVTTAIPTGTLAAPSSAGRALIRRKVGGTWTEDSASVVVWNDNVLTASLPLNRTIKLGRIGDEWWLLTASCS